MTLCCVQEEVSRRLAQLEEAVMRKSPSNNSLESSVDAFIPCRIKLSKDKDSISVHSERLTDAYRRQLGVSIGHSNTVQVVIIIFFV